MNLRQAVESVAPGDSRASFAELARGLRSLAETVPIPIELHLFSDLQKSDMPASFQEMTLPPNATLVPHPVVKDAAPNWTVESVSARPRFGTRRRRGFKPWSPDFHTPAATRTVSLVVNGKPSPRAAPACPPMAARPSSLIPWMCPTASAAAR